MIGHRRFQRLLPLHVQGTLDETERAALGKHLAECASCRRDVAELERLHALLRSVPPVEFPEEEVADARARAFARLHALRAQPGLRTAVGGFLSLSPVKAFAMAAAAVVLVLVGFWGGRNTALPPAGSPDGPAVQEDMRVTHVRPLFDDPLNPIVEIAYEQTRREVVRGGPGDPAIQRVLAQALMNGLNAGVRLRAVGAISGPLAAAPDPEVKAALLLALTSDPNDGVRKAALHALLRVDADAAIRDAMLQVVLHDPNPGLRIAAINGLDSLRVRGMVPDASARKMLEGPALHDENVVVRVKAKSLLEENAQWQ